MQDFTIFAFSTMEHYINYGYTDITRYAIPMRALARATPDDLLILPDNQHVRELVELYEEELTERPLNILWTRDINFQIDVELAGSQDLINRIQSEIDRSREAGRRVVIHPYSNTHDAQRWISQLRGVDRIIGDPPDLVTQYCGKDVYYPPVSNPDAETFPRLVSRLRIPPGYVCNDRRDLLAAANLLADRGIDQLLLKPVIGNSGSGIIAVRDRGHLDEFVISQPHILCQRIIIPISPTMGCEMNCAIEILDGKIFGPPTAQLIQGSEWIGGVVPGVNPETFQQQAVEQAEALLEHLLSRGLGAIGGLDFIADQRGDAFLVDNNLTRETGCHFPKYFQINYAPQQPFACGEAPVPTVPPGEFLDDLRRRGLAFSRQSRCGVFPFHYIRSKYSMLIAFGETPFEARRLLDEARAPNDRLRS